jgi:hypothetical protein
MLHTLTRLAAERIFVLRAIVATPATWRSIEHRRGMLHHGNSAVENSAIAFCLKDRPRAASSRFKCAF